MDVPFLPAFFYHFLIHCGKITSAAFSIPLSRLPRKDIMNPIQRLFRTIDSDKKTLKTLNWKQKIRFCFDYYRGFFFMLLVFGLILFYIGDLVIQSSYETVLQGFFTNDDYNLFPAKTIETDVSAYLGLKPRQKVSLEDSLYVELGPSNEYMAASQSKIVAYISAKELDFLVTHEKLSDYYMSQLSLYDLETLLDEVLYEKLKDHLIYQKDGTGVTKACGLDLTGSRYMEDAPKEAGSFFLVVPSTAPHPESVNAFIRYSYGLPIQ